MGSTTELDLTLRRARLAYERGRLKRAVLGMAPLLVIVVLAANLAQTPASTWWFGVATLSAGALMLWYGRAPQRAVFPGVMAGLVPLALALCANAMHTCGPSGCSSLCVPACMTGGLVAGLAVANIGHRRRAGVEYVLSASALALLTGSMGCACIGYAGVVGLVSGFAVGMVPGLLARAFVGR